MSRKKRTTISLEAGIIAKAREMMRAEDFGDFSGFLEQVIRERWEMRGPPTITPQNVDSKSATGKHRKPRTLPGHSN